MTTENKIILDNTVSKEDKLIAENEELKKWLDERNGEVIKLNWGKSQLTEQLQHFRDENDTLQKENVKLNFENNEYKAIVSELRVYEICWKKFDKTL